MTMTALVLKAMGEGDREKEDERNSTPFATCATGISLIKVCLGSARRPHRRR
jgi:hypothetical protein